MDWVALFPEQILDKGFSCFCQGAVGPLRISRGILTADVTGSQIYHVRLPLAEDRAGEFSCTCPFARKGRLCKHMAAVFFDWESQGSPTGDNVPALRPDQIHAAVQEADEALVRSYLNAVLQENDKLALQFHELWTMWKAGMPGSEGPLQ